MSKQPSIDIQLLERPLQVQDCMDFIADNGAGGVAIFVGTVRNQTKGRSVLHLEFEAYQPMAISEMYKIAAQATARWSVMRMAIHHRIGHLGIGEIAVIIGVSTPHRKAAFEACEYAIDTLKQSVPIWKKEIFEDGEVWVAAHP
ncbi:MAG: molybdenum cofactor biosynthesis protein MoaE [Bacteroidota bacterium]